MLTLRPAVPGDRAFLMAMTERLADFPVPAWRTAEQIAAADRRQIVSTLDHPNPGSTILIAEGADGGPAGCLFVTTRPDYFNGRPGAHVEVVVVNVAAQGQGVGRTLLEAAEAWARNRGYGHLTLNAFVGNSHARAVYEHLGYQAEIISYRKELA